MTSRILSLESSWLKYTYNTHGLSVREIWFDLTRRGTGARHTGNVKVTGKTCGRHSCTVKGTTIHTQHRKEASEYMKHHTPCPMYKINYKRKPKCPNKVVSNDTQVKSVH